MNKIDSSKIEETPYQNWKSRPQTPNTIDKGLISNHSTNALKSKCKKKKFYVKIVVLWEKRNGIGKLLQVQYGYHTPYLEVRLVYY